MRKLVVLLAVALASGCGEGLLDLESSTGSAPLPELAPLVANSTSLRSAVVGAVTLTGTAVNEAAGTANITLTLERPSSKDIFFHWKTKDGTARGGADFKSELVFSERIPAGSTKVTLPVTILADSVKEDPESFKVTVWEWRNIDLSPLDILEVEVDIVEESALVGGGDSSVSITSSVVGELTLSGPTVDEAAGTAKVKLSLERPSSKDIFFHWKTKDGTAKGGADFSSELVFSEKVPAGSTEVTLPVTILADAAAEGEESFKVTVWEWRNIDLSSLDILEVEVTIVDGTSGGTLPPDDDGDDGGTDPVVDPPTPTLSGTAYYVDPVSGNDSASGTSPATAWKTLNKVSSRSFQPGDGILFKRGTKLRGRLNVTSSGTADKPITYGAYGTGAKPEIWCSQNLVNDGDWTKHAGNIWRTTAALPLDTSLFMVGGHAQKNAKLRKLSLSELKAEGDFYWDKASNRAYLYSPVKPSANPSFNKVLEIPVQTVGIYVKGKSHLVIQDLVVRYSVSNAIIFEGVDNGHILRCEAHFGGGRCDRDTAYGNAFGLYNNIRNASVRQSIVSNWWDWGVVVEHWAQGGVSKNVVIEDNVISTSGGAIEVAFMHAMTSGSIEDVIIRNNTATDLGYGWAGYLYNLKGSGLQAMALTASLTLKNITFEDNIVDRYSNYALDVRGVLNLKATGNQFLNGTGDYGYTTHQGAIAAYDAGDGVTGRISDNLVQNQKGKYGIFIPNMTPPGPLYVTNNVIENTPRGGVVANGNANLILSNNVVK